MYNVLIVDDETIVRMMLSSMLDWADLDLNLVGSAGNGKEAMEYMNQYRIDILITDIQMPVVDGLTLIQYVKEMETVPEILVLSAYNDFPYVRQAFKMGIYDYCLKREIHEEMLKKHLQNMKNLLSRKGRLAEDTQPHEKDRQGLLTKLLRGQIDPSDAGLPDCYYVVYFSIQGYQKMSIMPSLINLAGQMLQIARHGTIASINDTNLLMIYEAESENNDLSSLLRVCTRLLHAWKNYINADIIAAVSEKGHGAEEFEQRFYEATMNLTMKYVMKSQNLFSSEDHLKFSLPDACAREEEFSEIIQALKLNDIVRYNGEKSRILSEMQKAELKEAKKQAIYLAYHIAASLIHQLEDADYIYTSDLFLEVSELSAIREVCIWTVNFLNDIKRYLQAHYQFEFPDEIQTALDYMNDNYYRSDLTLYEVASEAGYSEKYFSILFTKRVGISFSDYLKSQRIHHAKHMLKNSHWKLRKISEAVGYNSVEYFIRVFQAETGMSPSAYRKEHQTIVQ